jgi:hypothetical protein
MALTSLAGSLLLHGVVLRIMREKKQFAIEMPTIFL